MNKKNPIVAFLLSLVFLGGGGQIYCGQIAKGAIIMLITFFTFLVPIVSGFGVAICWPGLFISPIIWLGGAIDAYQVVRLTEKGRLVKPWGFVFY